MGDPETQPILLRLKSDFSALIEHALDSTLDQTETDWDRRTALCVVLAAGGYPENPQKGDIIEGLSELMVKQNNTDDFHIFHSGTAINGKNGQQELVTAGGRVLCVTALGDSLKLAQQHAYELAEQVHFNNAYMRHDIGYHGIDFIHKA